MTHHLQVKELSCHRQQKNIFTHLSFELHTGEFLLVEGQNGSGKSSLLRLLTGLSSPSAGEIIWNHQSIQSIREEYISQLHYVGHANGIKPHLTVEENLHLQHHLSLTAIPLNFDILASLQLSTHRNTYAKNLSAGQKRRLALVKLFLLPRILWILDEPLTALDTTTQEFFTMQLEKHLQSGGMAVMSSHQPLILKHVAIKSLRLTS